MNKRKLFIFAVVTTLIIVATDFVAMAEEYTVKGRPLNLYAYVTQGITFPLKDDVYDNEEDVNSAIWSLLIEGEYDAAEDLRFYGQFLLAGDWIYDVKHDDRSWNAKLFNKSRQNMYFDDEYWQIMKEVHITWTPRNFFFRLGKQTVSWGEMMGFRLMDQINPLDQRRGMADVEFETTIIPIWLLRAEYSPMIDSSWVQDLGFEFVFNPNADFIPNQQLLGNDEGGIWSPNILIPLGPGVDAHLGSSTMNIEEPDSWSEGHEYAFRLKGVVKDSILTLNYFYGRDDSPVTKMAGMNPPTAASDGKLIMHPIMEGYYPRFRFAGLTFSRDFSSLRADSLGGVAPVILFEAFYGFDNEFGSSINTIEKSDEIRWALGVDWKVRIPALNYAQGFGIGGQFYHRRIMDYPSNFELANLEDDNYAATMMVKTGYFNGKLMPSVFWMRDINNKADMFRLQLDYQYSHNWKLVLGALILGGDEVGKGFEVFDNKDQIYFRVRYQWG